MYEIHGNGALLNICLSENCEVGFCLIKVFKLLDQLDLTLVRIDDSIIKLHFCLHSRQVKFLLLFAP